MHFHQNAGINSRLKNVVFSRFTKKHFKFIGVESEWFWLQSIRNESEGDYNCLKYLEDYYPPKFTYQDFGPMLTMDFFDPVMFADLVAKSGAK